MAGMPTRAAPRITKLAFRDETLGTIEHDASPIQLWRGPGSGLSRGAGDPPGRLWAIGDRGPNLPTPDRGLKILPAPDVGPAISELQVDAGSVTALRTFPLRGSSGRPLTGLPLPGEDGEIAVDLAGRRYAGDPGGADTEAIAVARDRSFWVADEYAPSILRVASDGTVRERWVPRGTAERHLGADHPVADVLPAHAATRRLNRGFEGLALSPDERSLYVAMQSSLQGDADPRCILLWRLDSGTGALLQEYRYPFDEPRSFLRDRALGPVDWPDLKVCELAAVDAQRLLVLERGSATSRLYIVSLPLPAAAAQSAGGPAPLLVKSLLLDTDEHPEIGVDLEGMALLSPRTVLLVNDNDFGVAGVKTQFWQVDFSADV
jgi:hypothetical protein